MKKAIHWFRRDLRLADNTALAEAAAAAENVIPVFCWDPHILSRTDVGAPRVWFLSKCLEELAADLSAHRSSLTVLRGAPEVEIPRFAASVGAGAVFYNKDYEPYARHRDEVVSRSLSQDRIAAHPCNDLLLVEPEQVSTQEGKPYSVFTPFFRTWAVQTKASPQTGLAELGPSPPQTSPTPPSLLELGFDLPEHFDRGSWRPGERNGRHMLERFAEQALPEYAEHRDIPAVDGTSRLSPYLKFGNVSIRQVYHATASSPKFVQELAWREFYFHVLWHWPHVEQSPWQARMAALQWDSSPQAFDAWREGQTGFPFIDAGMRQLLRTGWMHNRVRMAVASFLIKDLHINWQEGERHFMLALVDGDLAPNNGGWQWAASTGADPRPFRVFNPWLQGEKYDPDGEYVREWVPQLRRVPAGLIHRPHLMTENQQREAGCMIGSEYPAPLVDHSRERLVAVDRYRSAKSTSL